MSEKHLLGWRGIMPRYHKFEWEDFRVKAEPVGIRRLTRWLPYFTGNEPEFKVNVDTISGELRQIDTKIEFFEPDWTEKEKSRELSKPVPPVNHVSGQIKLLPIAVSGDHRCVIRLSKKEGGSCQRDLITFRAIAQETMIGWAIGVFVAIAAIFVGILNLVYRL